MNNLDAHGLRTMLFIKAVAVPHKCQLCTVIHDWSKMDVFILDFAKTFDSVHHERPKAKRFGYGMNGKTLAWINKFLCQRHQRVAVNGSKSDWSPVVSGVSQGT